MPIPTPVSWASTIIGFVSFAITLLTLLGVYRDLISTIRFAPSQIPIQLGNLRQEIEAERLMLRRRCQEGDEFQVFVGRGISGRRKKRSSEIIHLLMKTVEKLWADFREIERPFLIRSGRRAEEVRKGAYWGDDDVDEKAELGGKSPGTPAAVKGGRRANAMGTEEANVGLEGNYYHTDFSHRFIWWQSRSDVQRLFEQVQRVQIRRIERDVFECDELVKRVLRKMDRDGGLGGEGRESGSGSDDPGPRGGGGGNRRGSRKGSAGAGKTVFESQETEFVRIPARSRAGSVRVASRAGSAARVRSVSPSRRRSPRFREREREREREGDTTASPLEQRPSNTARRRAARDSGPPAAGDHEYEVVRPGRDGTVYIDTSTRRRSRAGLRDQGQSYHRERDGTREQRGDVGGRDGERDRSRGRFDRD